MSKYAGLTALTRFWQNVKPKIDAKADTSHTHDRVNGLLIQVSTTVPTANDNTIITIVKPS